LVSRLAPPVSSPEKSDLDLTTFSANQLRQRRGSEIEEGNEACGSKAAKAAAAWGKQRSGGVGREPGWWSKVASGVGRGE
jgi:hypothetical protein